MIHYEYDQLFYSTKSMSTTGRISSMPFPDSINGWILASNRRNLEMKI